MWRGRGLPSNVRNAIIDRDGRICRYCGDEAKKIHIDHIVPVYSGGSDDPENLCVSCAECNLAKSKMTVAEFNKKREHAGFAK
jgi:5-methylcytosine-specific restriction endonuclease McrA